MLTPLLVPLIALASPAIASPSAAPAAQDGSDAGNWRLAAGSMGCAIHAADEGGTVVSVLAFPDQAALGFLIQNRGWTSLQEGVAYDFDVRFDEERSWPVRAVGRTRIDSDGPGVFFTLEPGGELDGNRFMAEFADAKIMHVRRGSIPVETIALTGNHRATAALAQCTARLWGGQTNATSPVVIEADVSDAPISI